MWLNSFRGGCRVRRGWMPSCRGWSATPRPPMPPAATSRAMWSTPRPGLQDPAALAGASMEHRRASSGARTTLDLPRDVHRTLKRLAADEDTSVQALVLTAIVRAYPDLA